MNSYSYPLSLVASSLLAICAISVEMLAPHPETPKKQTLPDIQSKYMKYPISTLKLIEPIEVKTIAYFKDGGSILWILRDAEGVDHSFRTYQAPNAPFYYYHGAKDEKGLQLKDGGAEQKELYAVWLRWIEKNVANAPAFLADRKQAESKLDAAALGLTFRALEKRIVEIAEKSSYPD